MGDLPLGYVFEPNREELVGLLTRKLSGQPLSSYHNNKIKDYDIYNDHPFKIMARTQIRDANGFTQGYFFSRIKKISDNGKRISRRIPNHGTWLEKAATKMVCDQVNNVFGIYKYYKFNPVTESKNSELNEDEWLMHEYSLVDNQDLMLCHITNKKDYKSNKAHNNGTRARKINMIRDDLHSLDCEAGPGKKSRVDNPVMDENVDVMEFISLDDVDDNADGGVYDDSSTLFEHGFKNAMEQAMAQQDDHSDHYNKIPAEEMMPIHAENFKELTWSTMSTLDPSTQERLNKLEAFLMS